MINSNGHNGWRTQAMYRISEAAHLANVSASTVRNWILGSSAGQRQVEPLFKQQDLQSQMVSFLQLIEIVVAANFRRTEHVSFQTVRSAYENARKLYHLDYPFAHLQLEALGGHIVHLLHKERFGTSLQALDQPEQWTLPGLVLEVIHRLDYESELAARWYPVGKEIPIVVDPRISAGLPVVSGRGVTVAVIYKRFMAGQKIDFIAQDFELKSDTVEEVVRYAEKVAA